MTNVIRCHQPAARNTQAARKLWEISEQLTVRCGLRGNSAAPHYSAADMMMRLTILAAALALSTARCH
jgi:hypothetical protein